MNETAIPKVTTALEVHMVYSSHFFFPCCCFRFDVRRSICLQCKYAILVHLQNESHLPSFARMK